MPRFSDRELQFRDLVGRFKARSVQEHMRNALGFTQRLKSEGASLLKDAPRRLARWKRGCDAVLQFLRTPRTRRDQEKEDLQTAMREFLQEFEHATSRRT